MPNWNYSDISSWMGPIIANLQTSNKTTDLEPFKNKLHFLDLLSSFNLSLLNINNPTVNNPALELKPLDYVKTTFNAESNRQALLKVKIKLKEKDPSLVLINTDAKKLLEGSMPDKIEKSEDLPDVLDKLERAGSVNQSLGQWGDLGVLFGQLLGNAIGGKAGTAISKAASGTQTTINAIKNLKSLKGVAGAGVAKAGNIGAIAGAVADVAGSFMPEKSEYSGDKGNITLTMDQIYDGISNAAMAFGPIGMIVGGAMKAGDLLGKGLNALGVGTDGMTTQDAIMGSSFFSWNVGLANSIGALKTDTITKDEDIFATIGSSYGGTNNKVDDAVTKSGKKYGNFSRGAYNKANRQIYEANRLLNIMGNISNEVSERNALRASMSAINSNKRALDLMGGYNQASIRVGKIGMKLSISLEGELPEMSRLVGDLPSIKIFKLGGELPEVKIFLFGGEIPTSKYLKFIDTLPENLKPRDGDNYNMKLLWELNGKPESFNDVKGIIFTYDKKDKLWHAPSVAYDENKDEYIFLKSLLHPTYNKELEWYFSPEAAEFRSKYKYDPISNKYLPIILKSMLIMKNGGEFNVIPDGALHKNLHHMELDGITKKGIPVVTDDGELTAEIEREEIILRLEVTEKLEKLNKIYQSPDSKKQEKEEAALEAGKLLVYEILNNTIDNTNLINKI